MTVKHSELAGLDTEGAVAAYLALRGARPQTFSRYNVRDEVLTVPDGNGSVQALDLERFGYRPHRVRGTATVHDADGFVAYLAKHGLAQTEVYADVQNAALVAVINAHEPADPATEAAKEQAIAEAAKNGVAFEPDETTAIDADARAGWGDHRVQLVLKKTPAWQAWEAIDRKLLDQVDFAEHVEERLVDFREPSGADMLELAQTFNAQRQARFESGHRLKGGETQLEYREETKASAGAKGKLAIPDEVVLGLVPFEGCEPYKVTARLRYRIPDGVLKLGVLITRPEDILRSAFLDIVATVIEKTGRTVINGVPAQALGRS